MGKLIPTYDVGYECVTEREYQKLYNFKLEDIHRKGEKQ